MGWVVMVWTVGEVQGALSLGAPSAVLSCLGFSIPERIAELERTRFESSLGLPGVQGAISL